MNKCAVCGKESEDEVCDYCNAEGYWIDPAGGIHSPHEEDPAKMYE